MKRFGPLGIVLKTHNSAEPKNGEQYLHVSAGTPEQEGKGRNIF
jgi:hypothetical protein